MCFFSVDTRYFIFTSICTFKFIIKTLLKVRLIYFISKIEILRCILSNRQEFSDVHREIFSLLRSIEVVLVVQTTFYGVLLTGFIASQFGPPLDIFPPSLTPSRNCTQCSGQGAAPSCCSRSKAWVRRCSWDTQARPRPVYDTRLCMTFTPHIRRSWDLPYKAKTSKKQPPIWISKGLWWISFSFAHYLPCLHTELRAEGETPSHGKPTDITFFVLGWECPWKLCCLLPTFPWA